MLSGTRSLSRSKSPRFAAKARAIQTIDIGLLLETRLLETSAIETKGELSELRDIYE